MIFASCILLAAGDSSRMGTNKLMLEFSGKTLIKKTVEEIKKSKTNELIIVTGFESEKIQKEVDAKFVHNPDFEKGMHTSIRAGVKQLCDKSEAFFITLADQPYFSHEVMNRLLEVYEPGKILCPVYQGKRGHPVLFSRKFVDEILNEEDGDFGLSYLLKRYPHQVLTVEMKSRDILVDIDTPEDYERALASDPVGIFHETVAKLRAERKSFSIATVIEVIGSASARTGSKAIFDDQGKNILGWVGGGCAERFIGEESLKALGDSRTRIVLADMDDEIFGLGVACGGKMRVFIEPIHPSEKVSLPDSNFTNEVRSLSGFYGWQLVKDEHSPPPTTPQGLLLMMAKKIAETRNCDPRSLRLVKEVPAKFKNKTFSMKNVLIIGRTRITEALARHFTLLSCHVRAIGPDLKQEDYPSHVQCLCLSEGYSSIEIRKNEVVIIASHTSQDPMLVEKAIKAEASYVGMIGSYKRSLEVLGHLDLINKEVSAPLYVPAGLNIDARNPDEIALSIVAEIIAESGGHHGS